MRTEGLVFPQVLWLLLWLQLCRGKCRFPHPTSWGQWGHGDPTGNAVPFQAPLRQGSEGVQAHGPSAFPWACLHLWQPMPGCIYRHLILGYPFGTPCSPVLYP